MTLTYELNLDRKQDTNQNLGQRSFCSKVIVGITQTREADRLLYRLP